MQRSLQQRGLSMSENNSKPTSGVTKSDTETSAESVFALLKNRHEEQQQKPLSLGEYLDLCREDPMAYASPAERLVAAIYEQGQPELVDTSSESNNLKRVFQSAKIKTFPAFDDFYGIENVVTGLTNFLDSAAANNEQKKQILLLMGPVGSAKSSLAHRLEELIETQGVYALKAKGEDGDVSPVLDNPLALLTLMPEMKEQVIENWNVPEHAFKDLNISSWANKRLEEAGGDLNEAFEVVKVYPSKANKRGVGYLQAKDDQTQDVSELIGRVDMNKLGEGLPENDPDVYLYSGGFPDANRGILHLSEAIKMPDVIFNPVLDGVQDRYYATPAGQNPMDAVIIATTNESEWNKFKSNPLNEAILDRIVVQKVPYTLRYSEEERIYEKILNASKDKDLPIAPKTLETLAKFSVMTRLSNHDSVESYGLDVRAKVYNGEIPDDASSKIPSIKDLYSADIKNDLDQGMKGFSTRSAFKTLSDTFNAHANEGERSADPLTLMEVLQNNIAKDDKLSKEERDNWTSIIKDYLMPEYVDFITQEIEDAFVGASDDVCQNMFNRYLDMADAWVAGEDYKDGTNIMSKEELDQKLREFEAPARIGNATDFRTEVTSHVNRLASRNEGGLAAIKWDSYEKMARVIRKRFSAYAEGMRELIKLDTPVLDEKEEQKRNDFLNAMEKKNYTKEMTRRAVGVYQGLHA
jgi:serine protein kinase